MVIQKEPVSRIEDLPPMSLRIFISYARADRADKEKLLRQLKVLERQGLVRPWEDGLIEVGSGWRGAIGAAMEGCDMALLLVSDAFLASDFIDSVELKRLLERRAADGLPVVPIILRSCPWRHGSIGSLQALPEFGRPLHAYREDNDERDRAWTAIAEWIAGRAREHAGGSGTESPQAAWRGAPYPGLHAD
jgi:hypothetical protein